MIALLVALALPQAAAATTTLGTIGRQTLPARGCAAFLWNATDRALIAMAQADPALLRVSIDGRAIDLARVDQQGAVTLGFGATTRYAGGDVAATREMDVMPRENLTAGAQVPQGTLQVDSADRDTVVLPVAGLVGCAS